MSKQDMYEILGVTKSSTEDEVKKAYRAAALKYHPDTSNGDSADFIAVQQAYVAIMEAIESGDVSQAAVQMPDISDEVHSIFADPMYTQYNYFEPSNPVVEYFERSVRAKNCKVCHGMGVVTKNVKPEQGFMGREQRLCICQRID